MCTVNKPKVRNKKKKRGAMIKERFWQLSRRDSGVEHPVYWHSFAQNIADNTWTLLIAMD